MLFLKNVSGYEPGAFCCKRVQIYQIEAYIAKNQENKSGE
jgi:hypothetical protein